MANDQSHTKKQTGSISWHKSKELPGVYESEDSKFWIVPNHSAGYVLMSFQSPMKEFFGTVSAAMREAEKKLAAEMEIAQES